MDIGTGIAIAGVWIFLGMACLSNTITSAGVWMAFVATLVITLLLGVFG